MGDGLKRAFAAARATRKQSTEWHRQCFANFSASVAQRRREAERRAAELEKSESELSFYSEQIATADARGLGEFDRERFLVKRARK